MLIGATFGRMMGQAISRWFPDAGIEPSIYALVGSTAMMSGFSRITISLCVIYIELTENTQYLLPIMMAVMCAKWVGDALSKSIYDALIDLKSIPFLHHHPPHFMQAWTVADAMHTEVECLHPIERVSRIVRVLERTKHHGFPIVTTDDKSRPKTFQGFILRKQLLNLLHRQIYQQLNFSPPGMLDYEHWLVVMNHKTIPLETIKLPPKEVQDDLVMDVLPYMDRSQVVIQSTWSFMDAYKLFSVEGLRHLPVIDEHSQVVGMLTRHDLLSFHWR